MHSLLLSGIAMGIPVEDVYQNANYQPDWNPEPSS
jgi:hypothetical protein